MIKKIYIYISKENAVKTERKWYYNREGDKGSCGGQ